MACKRLDFNASLLVALALTGLITASAIAADPTAKPAAANDRTIIDAAAGEMVKLVGEGRIDQMLDRIGPTLETEREEYERQRERLIAVYGNAGKYSGFDIAGFKALTPRFQVEYVLVYFEKRPVLFEFGFYQVDGKWRPQHVRVETDFKALLDTLPLQK
jgi:hypothetical protein